MTTFYTLTDWTEQYVKNKDLILRNIVNIVKEDGGWTFAVIRKDGTQHVLVMPEFKQEFLQKMKPEINAMLVMHNTMKNVEKIVENWQELVKFPKLALVFANPDANGDKRWIIFPHTHDKIIERKALRRGLESLYMTVEPI